MLTVCYTEGNQIATVRAYEPHKQKTHVFELFDVNIPHAAPYIVLLDGSFLCDAEMIPEAMEEITHTIELFSWIYKDEWTRW